MALKLAEEVDGDIVVGNDPDVDRTGLFVRDAKTGGYVLFNGNMLAIIIAEYVITRNERKKYFAEQCYHYNNNRVF